MTRSRATRPRQCGRGRPTLLAATRRMQTTDPKTALAAALRTIAKDEGTSVRDADELPAVGSTITMTPARAARPRPGRVCRPGAQRRRARMTYPRRPRTHRRTTSRRDGRARRRQPRPRMHRGGQGLSARPTMRLKRPWDSPFPADRARDVCVSRHPYAKGDAERWAIHPVPLRSWSRRRHVLRS
jgi:hypothetical protein